MSDDSTSGGRLDTRARAYIKAKHEAEAAAAIADEKAALKRQLELELHADLEETLGDITTFSFNDPEFGKVKITKRTTRVAGILNPEMAIEAIKAEGLEAALLGDRAIRKKVANELARNRHTSGEPMPDGLEIVERPGITVSIPNRKAA